MQAAAPHRVKRPRRSLTVAVLAGCVVVALLDAAPARAASCRSELGARRAETLVQRCTEVSTATRPPCNAANSCAMIEDEIRRGCQTAEEDAPDWCGEYDD